MGRGLILSKEGVAPVGHSEVRVESKCKAVSLLVCHLWSSGLDHDPKNQILDPTISNVCVCVWGGSVLEMC